MKRVASVALLVLGALAAAYACVPADTRPPPATLTVTVSGAPSLDGGVTTADGWHVTFDRAYVAMGNEGFSDSCVVYGEAGYDRIINLAAGPKQKLGILHGLGNCDLRFRIAPPSEDTLLGASVSQADKDFMRIPLPDPYIIQNQGQGGPGGANLAGGAGTAVDIAGTAVRGDVTKRFRLINRQRIRYQRCNPQPPPPDASTATLTSPDGYGDAGDAVVLQKPEGVFFDLLLEPEAVLRDDLNPTTAELRFDPFAKADTDGDGIVTLDELRNIPIESVRDAGAFEAGTYDIDDAGLLVRGKPIAIESLGDFVYYLLTPALVRFRDTGWCVAAVGRRRPD